MAKKAKTSTPKGPPWMILDKFWRIDPIETTTKDGAKRTVTVEHAIGSDTAYTMDELFEKTGLEGKFEIAAMYYQKNIKRYDRRERLIKMERASIYRQLGSWINRYRDWLTQTYAAQNLKVCMGKLPQDEEEILYIQALKDSRTDRLCIGEVGDLAAWTLHTAKSNKCAADKYVEAKRTAKAILALPSVRKDIQRLMTSVTKGELPKLTN